MVVQYQMEKFKLQYKKKINAWSSGGFYKLYRFALIYGVRRALVKALGRLRVGSVTRFVVSSFNFFKKNKCISVVGCGQFTYSTSSFFLVGKLGNCIDACFDIDNSVTESYSKAYDAFKCTSFEEILIRKNTKLVYIASNHASHTRYAIKCLEKGLDVYIEKPISVTYEQFFDLQNAYRNSSCKMFVGYNRPFSKAIVELKQKMGVGPITLTCTIIGHKLEPEHWYRIPEEGTRICGNLGHWIDLAIHLLAARIDNFVKTFKISISYADERNFDDNISINIITNLGDLVVLVMTAREEPFEGISENIIFQQEGLFAKIDDFKRAEFQVGHKKFKRTYFPKDVGHKQAILQPFRHEKRDLEEVFLSTEIMLYITDMVRELRCEGTFKVKG